MALGIFGFLAVVIVGSLSHSFLYGPVYSFPDPAPFSGQVWFNPYKNVDGTAWKLGNFQVQSDAWSGVTNGRANTPERIFEVYKELGYDIITISDYMSINPFTTEDRPLVRVYEHGYGAFKTHQVCLGAQSVTSLDYPLYQTRSNKQHIIDRLSAECQAVAIAHPSLRNAYSFDDMARLTGYSLVEASSKFRMSMAHWDAALSGGKPVWILSNDDAHDLNKPWEYGRNGTMVHTTSLEEEAVVQALVSGRAYAYLPGTGENANHGQKVAHLTHRPELKGCQIVDDSLQIAATIPIRKARFIGQDSDTLKTDVCGGEGCASVAFRLKPEHTYVRAEVELTNGDVFLLNPVIRTHDGLPPQVAQAQVNRPATLFRRGCFGLMYLVPLLVGLRVKVRRGNGRQRWRKFWTASGEPA